MTNRGATRLGGRRLVGRTAHFQGGNAKKAFCFQAVKFETLPDQFKVYENPQSKKFSDW
jgi:hypothetical protein